jgi:hypothetical protein
MYSIPEKNDGDISSRCCVLTVKCSGERQFTLSFTYRFNKANEREQPKRNQQDSEGDYQG